MEIAERWVRRAGGLAALAALAVVFAGMWRGLRRPAGRITGQARHVLRPGYYLTVGTLYFGFCYLIWRPIHVALSLRARAAALVIGALIYFSGLALVVWGRLTLGPMYNVSSGFGVRLYAGHRLVTRGPYAYVRHPMYLGILLAGLGGTLLYRTWTLLFVTAQFGGLAFRARREEQALAAEFGDEWQAYCRQVPPWLPRVRRKSVHEKHSLC